MNTILKLPPSERDIELKGLKTTEFVSKLVLDGQVEAYRDSSTARGGEIDNNVSVS